MRERDSVTVSDRDITLSLSMQRFVSTMKQNSCHCALVVEGALKFQRKRDITTISLFGCKDKDTTLSLGDARSNTEETKLNVDDAAKNRHRCDSTSSSGSSSSDSSSSSSSSTNTFFYEGT
ncbi:uncharacterized protein LOC123659637 [Melitaea cinxia]|uniref:uncharacterized protein LOC123659637 n=1 Tax=Melitaea cinxia TaxID=113334 RepID=UPI001E273328|nr:uncharacterized protein LOC123659637 [Melitaea cinxia]